MSSGWIRAQRAFLLSEAWRHMPAGQRCVGLALAALADHATGEVTVSYSELAELSGTSRKIVRSAIAALEGCEVLSPTRGTPRADDRAHLWTQRGIAYRLMFPGWIGASAEGNGIPKGTPEDDDRAQGVPSQPRGVPSQPSSPYIEKGEEERRMSHAKRRARSSPKPPSPEALKRAEDLHRAILTSKPDHRLAAGLPDADRTRWATDIDKLNRLDTRSWERIDAVIAYLPRDEFWRDNVQSGTKLRRQFDRLEANQRKARGVRKTRGPELELDPNSPRWVDEAEALGIPVMKAGGK